MDGFRHHRSPPAERFLGFFSSSPPADLTAAASDSAGVELHEDEVLWTGADFSAPTPSSPAAGASPTASSALSPSAPSPRSFRGLSEKNFGILAALPEEEKQRAVRKPVFLHRSSSSISSSPISPSSSSSSSARMIPAIPKPKHLDYSLSVPGGMNQYQSAPLSVPVAPRRQRRSPVEESDGDDYDGDEMLPPHELVARKDAPMTTFSVLEGVGRTLKGRDLRRVRNAVWRQTGFID